MDEVFGRYRLLSLIGQGGMGRVFKAHDTVIGRDVAVKVLPTELASEPGYRERFRREAQIAAQLTEPHVIPIHDTGEVDGHLYLVMPVIDGIDVGSLIRRDGPMSPQLAVKVIEQLAAALDGAHQQGLVHRDVKPSNALMTRRDFVYLIDFGIAHDTATTHLTRTGMLPGTLAYMAPERFAGKADARSDVYALAGVLFECLTGSKPFPGESLPEQMRAHLDHDPPRPSALWPGIPPGLDAVVARGMAKDPDERYQTAGELADAAHQALADAGVGDTRPGATLITGGEASGVKPPAPLTNPPAARTNPPASLTTPGRREPADSPTVISGEQATQLNTTAAGSGSGSGSGSGEPWMRRNAKWLAVAAVAVVIVAVVAAVVVGSSGSDTPQATPTTSTSRPATSPAQSSAPPTQASTPLARLQAVVPSGVQCNPVDIRDPKPAGVDWLAELECPGQSGLASLDYRLFADNNSLTNAFSQAGGAVVPCPGRGSAEQWSGGSIKCLTDPGGAPAVYWTLQSELVLGSAKGPGGSAVESVYQWWAEHYEQ